MTQSSSTECTTMVGFRIRDIVDFLKFNYFGINETVCSLKIKKKINTINHLFYLFSALTLYFIFNCIGR